MKIHKTKKIFIQTLLITLLPMPAFAASRNLRELVLEVRDIIDLLIPLLFAAAVLLFLYGVFRYFFVEADKPESRKKGREFIMWGIVALFIMVSFWGFVNILSNTFFGTGSGDLGGRSDCFKNPSLCKDIMEP